MISRILLTAILMVSQTSCRPTGENLTQADQTRSPEAERHPTETKDKPDANDSDQTGSPEAERDPAETEDKPPSKAEGSSLPLTRELVFDKLDKILGLDRHCTLIDDLVERKACFNEVEIRFSDPFEPLPNARKERILVVETPITRHMPLVYRSKFVDFFTMYDGRLVKEDWSMKVPKNLKRIFDLSHEVLATQPYPLKNLTVMEWWGLRNVTPKSITTTLI